MITKYNLKLPNKYVLSSDLNQTRVLACLTLIGRSFHKVGAATLKDLCAKVFLFVSSTSSFLYVDSDLRPIHLVGISISRFCRYSGACLLRHL